MLNKEAELSHYSQNAFVVLLYPRHTKYVEGYIVFVFPSVHPSVRSSGVNIFSQSFA